MDMQTLTQLILAIDKIELKKTITIQVIDANNEIEIAHKLYEYYSCIKKGKNRVDGLVDLVVTLDNMFNDIIRLYLKYNSSIIKVDVPLRIAVQHNLLDLNKFFDWIDNVYTEDNIVDSKVFTAENDDSLSTEKKDLK